MCKLANAQAWNARPAVEKLRCAALLDMCSELHKPNRLCTHTNNVAPREGQHLFAMRRQSHSQIMSTYYVFLWAVEGLNLLRILLQIATSTEASHPALVRAADAIAFSV